MKIKAVKIGSWNSSLEVLSVLKKSNDIDVTKDLTHESFQEREIMTFIALTKMQKNIQLIRVSVKLKNYLKLTLKMSLANVWIGCFKVVNKNDFIDSASFL